MKNWWTHKSANKRSRWKKFNYMGLSELMRMIIIFLTSVWIKKKFPQGLRGKEYRNQFSLQSKGAVTVEDYWTQCQYYDIVWVCFMFGNCNHCCLCCGHPFTMLGVSLFTSCKNKIQCVCVKKKRIFWLWTRQLCSPQGVRSDHPAIRIIALSYQPQLRTPSSYQWLANLEG